MVPLLLALHLAVYIAEQYSTYFHFLVIDRFITQRQVELRNIGAVSFVELNAAVSRMLERTEGRIGHSGHFIQVAKNNQGIRGHPRGNRFRYMGLSGRED